MFDILVDDLPTCIRIKDFGSIRIDTTARTALEAIRELENPDRTQETKIKRVISLVASNPSRFLADEKTASLVFLHLVEYLYQIDLTAVSSTNSTPSAPKIMDYEQDASMIYSAMKQIYHLSLEELKAMHWWEFKALFDSLPYDSTVFGRVVHLRKEKPRAKATSEERLELAKRQNAVKLKPKKKQGNMTTDGKTVVSEAFSSL